MENIEIIVNSCDKYEDVWTPLFCCLKEFWPNIQSPIILNTESKNFKFPGLDIRSLYSSVNQKKSSISWGCRLIDAIKAVESEFILMIFDDYILEAPVDEQKINRCKNWLIENSEIAAFYLIEGGFPKKGGQKYEGFSEIIDKTDFLVNTAPALWRKEVLLSFVGKNDTPWAWEYFGSARAYRKNYKFYSVSNKEDEIYKYKYYCGGAIHQGKWVHEVIDPVIKKYNLNIDCSIRGYDENIYSKRKLSWYLAFYATGFRMIGFDVFIFVFRALGRLFKRFK